MRAKWEYGYDDHRGGDEDRALTDGWEPFAVHDDRVLVCRLVVARCEAGHKADFDDGPTCKKSITAERLDGEHLCGKPILAVPVDPYNQLLNKG